MYRRSALDPLFYPYYINYGANKVEMYVRLRAMQCVPSLKRRLLDNTPFLLSKEFGFDIPHQRTSISLEYASRKKNRPMFSQYVAFSALSRKWIKSYLCFL